MEDNKLLKSSTIAYYPLPTIAQYIDTPPGQKAFVGGILSRIRASALATRSMIWDCQCEG